MVTFGDRLRTLRKEKDLTLDELKDLLQTTKATLSRYENNKREPSAEFIKKVAQFFDVSIDYILGKTDFKYDNSTSNILSYSSELLKGSKTLDDILNLDKLTDNEKFLIVMDFKLKKANLYKENIDNEKKQKLVDKIVSLLEIMENK